MNKNCQCEEVFRKGEKYWRKSKGIVEKTVDSCLGESCINHLDSAVMPSREAVIDLLEIIRDILFPGYFEKRQIGREELPYHIGERMSVLFQKLSDQITKCIVHECRRHSQACQHCIDRGFEVTVEFMNRIPALRELLALDVQAAFDGDPAARSFDEIIFCYPGFQAITVYRIAHELLTLGVPLMPRIMTEQAHGETRSEEHTS
ncbi:MAG: serine acetyltransferase, partial [Candidatus Wallbacteria bacterium]|nr:serine acetyltransferase [Candidatus Wallbacteria bacterium]